MNSSDATPLPRRIFGLTRKQRYRLYLRAGLVLLAGFVLWAWLYLQPSRWYKYTDQIAFEQVAEDVQLGHVIWEPASIEAAGLPAKERASQAAISSDGARMVFSTGKRGGNADLFLRRWNGTVWGEPQKMRALNSAFHETAPTLSGDGRFLFFSSDRPGGRGGDDIWVAKWDGTDYAWPLPLTGRVNTPFDETDPALAPDGQRLYFASNRPYVSEEEVIRAEHFGNNDLLAEVDDLKGDFDLYAADIAGDTPFDLVIERQLSMLYSLREGALADPAVMEKLGGSTLTESAIDRGLKFLAETQEEDGRWDIKRSGGQGGHDVAATAFALLAYYGRGERHDRDCHYRETVARGLQWLLAQQDRVSGDLRGPRPQHNAMYDMGIATLALVEAYGVTKDPTLRPRVIAAIEFCTASQHKEGGWRYKPGERGDLSVTGWYLMALASAEMSGIPVHEETLTGAKKFLRAMSGGKHGGSYGYTDSPGKGNSNRPGMDAAGFFCSQLIGASPNGARAYESARILAALGLKPGDLYYTYYGTLASYQYQGPLWRSWRERMQKDFVRSQAKDGSWRPGGGHGGAMGKAVGTAITVLCLEAHYRYTPLYGLGYEPNPDGPVPGALDHIALAPTPLFRHAKYLEEFNSPADDSGPIVTEHGDFLYFASAREGGFGGNDLYRARISGPISGSPENLGEEVNSPAEETHPAIRMAGFHLLFNSTRDGEEGALFGARSKRLEKRYDYAQLPSVAWLLGNLPWLLLFFGAAAACAWLTRRAIAATKSAAPEPPSEGTVT
jgi:hypothetical protein